MKVLVTGATGQTGRALMRILHPKHEVCGTSFSRARDGTVQLDLRDNDAVAKLFATEKPDVVVHCAAERRPDVSESDTEGTRSLNVSVSEHLARLCCESGSMMVHFSTDYVFDGTSPPYSPASETNPLQFYGVSKQEAEGAVLRAHPTRAAVLRVPVLYAKDAESLDESATTVIAKDVLNSSKQSKLDNWGKRYPTLVDDVALCVANMIEYEAEKKGSLAGVWHCACTGEQFTKYTIALLIAEILGVAVDHLSGDPEPPKGAPRPRDTRLDCSGLEALGLLPKMTPLREALPAVLAPFKPA